MSVRYEALTLDGSVIYKGDCIAEITERVIKHREKNLKPEIAYIYDYRGISFYRYNTIKRYAESPRAWVLSQHLTFDEMYAELQRDIQAGEYR